MEPFEADLNFPKFNSNDILKVDPSYMRAFGYQEDTKIIYSPSQNYPLNNQKKEDFSKIELNTLDEPKNTNLTQDFPSDNQYDISNHIIFDKIVDLRDIKTQTQP